jgi:hypothetical protein
MIFPDKPRPPWQYQTRTRHLRNAVKVEPLKKVKVKQPLPVGYWRERIELALILIGFFFWIQFWIQFK